MKFDVIRQDIDLIEQKKQVTLEDIMKLISDLGLDISSSFEDASIQDLPVVNTQDLSVYMRQWALTLSVILEEHRDELVQESRFSRLEALCNALSQWEQETATGGASGEGTQGEQNGSIAEILSEYESKEEQMKVCLELQEVFQEHLKQVEEKKCELVHEKKKLAIQMLRFDE